MHTKVWSENLKGRDHSEDLDMNERIILDWMLEEKCGKFWTGFMWLRLGTSGCLL
jgi:hypothetical protein